MRIWLLSILLTISSAAWSQQFLLPFRSGDLWGYADSFGNIVIEPKYDSVSIVNENQRWEVYINGRVGVIDSSGVELLKPIYSGIKRDPKHSEYHDYYVQLDSLMGYSYMNGDFIIEPKYKELIACEFNYRYDHTEAYNFIVSEDYTRRNTYALIDKEEDALVSGITDIAHVTDHFYQFRVDDRWGIYNTIAHKWSMENRFDTIIRFDNYYDHSHDLIDKPYVFYAMQNGKFLVVNRQFEIEECSRQKLDSLLLPPFKEEEERGEIPSVELITSPEGIFVDLSTFPENSSGFLDINERYSSKIKFIRLLRERKQVGLEIVTSEFHSFDPEYDAIYANIDENRRINHTYFLVRKKDKWGVYGLAEDRMVVPVEYDSIVKGPYLDLLVVYKKEQVGILLMGSVHRDAPTYFFRPEFDQFLFSESARSNDFEYDSHDVYFFEKDGVVYPISQHGVKLYD